MKYRPIVKTVEAYQYTGHNAEEFVERFGAERVMGTIFVATTHGVSNLEEGDWLLFSNKTVTVVSDCAFKSRYEPAE